MARGASHGVMLAAVAWMLAGGCAHGPGAAPPAPDLAARACAGIDAFSVPDEEAAPEAVLARGQALYCLGLYGASLAVLSGPMKADRAAALRWLVYIHRRFPGWQDVADAVGAAARDDLDRPELRDVRDELHALAGRFEYQQGRYDKAVELLRTIPASSPLHLQAVLLEGAIHVRLFATKAAMDAFEEVLRAKDGDLRDLANVSLARTYYSTGQFEAASRTYDLLPPPSPYWTSAALEGSWTSFQMKDYPRALARLRALRARPGDVPIETMAEALLLQATIALYDNHLEDVTELLKAFNDVYPGMYMQARQLSDREPEALFDLGFSVRAGGALPPPLGAGPARFLLADAPVARRFDEVEELRRELARYQTLDAAWRSSPHGQLASTELTMRRLRAAREAGELFRRRLQRLADDLAVLIKRAIKLEYESMPRDIGDPGM